MRSFRAATLTDIDCALCRWGIAWALGPSVNHDMKREDVPIAIDAIVQARAYAPDPASRERALIEALARRYSDDPKADADKLARDYADAMRKLAARYPDDADIAVLTAEAIMNAHPYDYWKPGGAPQPWTPEIVALLDRATRIAPDHPGAHHYRIHLYEASTTPAKALASADRIGALAPSVGHLVHMPSHIYLRVGRYHEAVLANAAAVESDRAYLAAVNANPTYAADYVPHNIHFLWASALWSGESKVAMQAAEDLARAAERLPQEPARRGTRQHMQAAPWLTLVRYQQWDALLARPQPKLPDAPYLAGLIHFARGMAYAAKGDVEAARGQAEGLRVMERRANEQKLKVKNINTASALLRHRAFAAGRGDRARPWCARRGRHPCGGGRRRRGPVWNSTSRRHGSCPRAMRSGARCWRAGGPRRRASSSPTTSSAIPRTPWRWPGSPPRSAGWGGTRSRTSWSVAPASHGRGPIPSCRRRSPRFSASGSG